MAGWRDRIDRTSNWAITVVGAMLSVSLSTPTAHHVKRAGFAARLIAEHSIFIESFLLYELTVQSVRSVPLSHNPQRNADGTTHVFAS